MTAPKSKPGPKTELHIAERARAVREGAAPPTPTLAVDLDRLFETHRGRVHALCLRLLRDEAQAEEMVQETLLRAYEKLPEFHGGARFGTWIYGIARNLCFNAIRKRSDYLSEDGVLEPMDPGRSVLSQLREEERTRLLHEAALAVLTEQEQEAVHLRYVECLSQDQITDILRLDGSGARGLLQRCRRKLGRELRRRLGELGQGESLFQKTI